MGSHKCAPVSNELTALWYEPADALKHPALNLVSESESLYSIVDTLRKGQANLLMRSCTEAM